MNDYDFYLRHASVHDGAWNGFSLAWRGLVGKDGLPQRPHLRWRPWVLDPANPDDPTLGDWGVWQWHFDVALLDPFVGLMWTPPVRWARQRCHAHGPSGVYRSARLRT